MDPQVTYSIAVTARRRQDALAIRDAILANGLTAPIPSIHGVMEVEVIHYSEAVLDLMTGSLIMTIADDDAFRTLDLGLNGDPFYATLTDGMVVPTASGWDAVRFTIPFSDFEYDPTPGARWRNDYDIRYTVKGSPEVHRSTGSLEYESD